LVDFAAALALDALVDEGFGISLATVCVAVAKNRHIEKRADLLLNKFIVIRPC
jgi:hypothetical protein